VKIAPIAPPVGLVKAVDRVRHHLLRLHQSLAPAQVAMAEFVVGAWLAQAIAVAADLRIADALADGPLGCDELADRLGADPDALGRLLRALVSRGIFRRRSDGRYDLTPLAATLRWEAPDSVAAFARFVGSAQHHEYWSHCIDAVRTDESVVPKLHGMEAFDWIESQPELNEVFNLAMTNLSEMAIGAVTAAYDFARFRTVVDVAGGHGRLLAGILAATPTATGVHIDRPHVVAGAEPLLSKQRVAERVRIVEGSLFGIAVHLDDGVIQIDHDEAIDPGQQRGSCMQLRQETGCDGIELTDMAESELTQERPQRRGRSKTVPIAP
jgi:hypothetical protein